MNKSITIKGAEVTICGCVFVVNYRYIPSVPATHWQPADPAEVDILRAEIKGQPDSDSDAEELLEAIKIFFDREGRHTNGYDILQQKLLEEHKNEI